MPISIEELNGLYGQGPGPKPKIVPPKKQEAFDLKDLDRQPQSPISVGEARPTDVEDYGKYLDQGVYSDQDIESQRGQHQSVINKIGHAIGNLPLNILGSVIEGVGDLGLLGAQWGDDRTYTNALIEAGKAMHNVTGDIYMRNQHNTLGATLSDPSWWIDQVEGLAEFGVAYAALGAGVGGSLSKLAEAGTTALRAGQIGTQTGRMLGQLGTAGYMAYTMGASNAGQVFQDTYDYQFKKMINQGLSPDEASQNAKHIAAQSAATTAQLTTGIGTVLALGSMGAYFRKSSDAALDILKKAAPQLPGETLEQWAGRVKSIDPDAYSSILVPSKSWGHKLAEMGKMGVEMQQLQFGHRTGEELGKEGRVRGFIDQFGELENYLDRTMDKDGALAFGIGALSGLGIDYLRERVIPSRWADQIDKTTGEPIPKLDEEGNPISLQRKLYTPKALSEMHAVTKFNNIRDAIAYDIEQFDAGQKAYLAAMKSGDMVSVTRERDNLFNQHNVSAIIHGTGDMWKKTYEEISNLSPEEATQRGYTSGPEDQTYKEAAQKAASNLEQYQKMYDRLQKRYGTYYEQNQGFKPVVDGVFSRQVHLDAWDKGIQEHKKQLESLIAEENNQLRELYPGDPLITMEADKIRNLYASTQTYRGLDREHKELGKAIDKNDTAAMAAYVREYMGVDKSGNMDIVKAAKAVHANIEWALNYEKTDMQRHKDSIQVPEGQTLNERITEMLQDLHTAEYQHQIWKSETKWEAAKKNLAEVIKEKNLVHMADKYAKYMDQLQAEAEKMDKEYDKEIANRAKNQDAWSRKDEQQRDAVAERYRQAHEAHLKELKDEQTQYDRLKAEYDRLKSEGRDWLRRRSLKSQMDHLQKIMKGRNRLLEKYQKGYEKYKTAPNPDTTEEVIDTNNVTTNAPTHVSQATNVEVPDPQFEGVQEQVEVIQPDADKMQQEENKLKQIEEDTQQLAVQEKEDKAMSLINKYGLDGGDYEHPYNIFNIINDRLNNGRVYLPDDMFNYEVMNGKLTPEQAKEMVDSINDYMKAINESESHVEDHEYNAQAIVYDNNQGIDTTDIDMAEDPEIPFTDESNAMAYYIPEDDGQGGITFSGAKTVDAATIANSTLGYIEFAPNHNKEIELISQKDQLNMKTNPDVLKPGKLMPGTRIRFEVDTEYDGPKNIVGQLKQDEYGNVPQGRETFQDYADENGNIPASKMGNVPIKIVDDATNKTIGYVRKHDWVTERYGKDSGLRNIAERFDEDGNEINGDIQSKRILDIRKAIVDKYNTDRGHTTGRTLTKGVGHPILNTEVNKNTERSKVKPAFAFNKKDGGMLPDPKLEIVVVDNGTLMAGKAYPTAKTIAGSTKDLRHGSVMILLPGANGEHLPTPLIGKGLGETEIPHRTISRAIELYLSYDGQPSPITSEINRVRELTGFDLSNEKGLRNFINQYFTHTQRFDDTAMQRTGPSKFLFNVWDKIQGKESKAWIKAGMTGSGNRPIMATLDANGKLSQEFSDILKEGLATRTKAVTFTREGIRGINERTDVNRPFIDIHYRSDGRWHPTNYTNYNEYVKSFSKTTAYGKNKIGDDYIYTANPSISYDVDGLDSKVDIKPNDKASSLEVPEAPQQSGFDESLATELDDIFNAMPRTERKIVKEIGTAPEKSKPLNIKNLEDLYTFTPEDQRNGKVPADVLRELQDRGHTFLSDGYNPFSLCL